MRYQAALRPDPLVNSLFLTSFTIDGKQKASDTGASRDAQATPKRAKGRYPEPLPSCPGSRIRASIQRSSTVSVAESVR